ncbi:SPOR domain-containing protein [Motiliproteus sp. MSK22-1]|uniref:SPOR domain-containing protein n=1 Tax=Motiliproteus sp. MSK22-1 TaxID=1897630 RepID=UPI00097856BB|nr:SPOR domain-containing protein [Motiliproteus sp. MSK22-1]OMH39543.1 hypothetical protein BGP75_02845 [Motiliproteus sp. MSK22-1]
MAHDYANRPKKRKPSAKRTALKPKAKAVEKPSRRRLWLAIVPLLLLPGFGYGLYKLATVKPDPVATQKTVTKQGPAAAGKLKDHSSAKAETSSTAKKVVATSSNSDKSSDKSGAGKEEGFKFYKLLPESKVVPPKVEAYKSTPKSAKNHSRYLLQAGSFRSATDADSLRAKLILLGLPNVSSSKVSSANGTVWYRVRVGPFESRSKLNKAQDQMVRMRLQPLQIKIP